MSVEKIIKSGKLSGFKGSPEGQSGGYWVQALEEFIKEKFDIRYAVTMNSATACLHAALISCGIKQNDIVLTTPMSFSSSASVCLLVGANPEWIDIEDQTFCMNPDKLLIKYYTRAMIPVDLCGHPCDYDRIQGMRNFGVKIIEDAAQAIGAKYKDKYCGTFGDCGVFSFNQSKQISTGEGGVLLTNDENICRISRAVRNHAEVSDPSLQIVGYNYRMCEIEAYLALEQLKKLDENIQWRNELTSYVSEELSQIEGLIPPIVKSGCYHSWYTYALKVYPKTIKMTKLELIEALRKEGVYFGSYVKPLYTLPIYGKKDLCPVAEKMYYENLIVTDTFRPEMKMSEAKRIVSVFKSIL